ncbi:hypothetical protein WDU94_004171 [Cyamophila willieti]
MFFKSSFPINEVFFLCFIGWGYCMPLKMSPDTEEKLLNKITNLLDSKSAHKELPLDPSSNGDPMHTKGQPQESSSFLKNSAVNDKQYLNLNSQESQYSEAVQKMFRNAKTPIVEEKEHQISPQTSEEQLSMGTFNKGESVAMLVTGSDKNPVEEKTEAPEILMTSTHSVTHLIRNITQSMIITPKTSDSSIEVKQSAGSKFLASMSPEEFLKRLKKHLEISKSNLRILKKNFHDFLKEKEKLFRLNQKVTQEHPHPSKEIDMSIIRTNQNGFESSYVQDARSSVAFPTVNYPQPISQICPKDCPVNMIHIEHHHHGNSPVPCICESDNLFMDNIREESSISDYEAVPLKSFKSKLTKSTSQLKAIKSNVINMLEKSTGARSSEGDPANNRLVPLGKGHSTHKENGGHSGQFESNNEHVYENIHVQNLHNERHNNVPEYTKDGGNPESKMKARIINTIQKYYQGCEKPTTHIPAACDIACVPCKTPGPDCTTCVQCPKTCPPTCQSGSVIKTEAPLNLCPQQQEALKPPEQRPNCPAITCPPNCPSPTTKCTTTCPPTCPCERLIEDDNLESNVVSCNQN